MCFDVSTWELFWPFTAGSKIGLLYKDNNHTINIIDIDKDKESKKKKKVPKEQVNDNSIDATPVTIKKLKGIYEQINHLVLTKDIDIDIKQQERVKQLLKKYAHIMS